MSLISFVAFIALLGAGMGSFGCCQARRMQLRAEGKEKQAREKRSFCLSCHKQLRWYDNVPILSWILLRGKCRYCGKKIGGAEIMAELAGMVGFLLLFRHFYVEYLGAGVTGGLIIEAVIAGVLLTVLIMIGVYDGLTRQMPVSLLWVGVVLAGGYFGIEVFLGKVDWLSCLGCLMILPGLYYILYKVSGEKLVGGGDWVLCLMIALLVHDWWLGLLTVFLANFLGSIVMLPLRKKKVAFGPFLVAGFMVVFGFSEILSGLWLGGFRVEAFVNFTEMRVGNVGIDLSGANIGVAEEGLD